MRNNVAKDHDNKYWTQASKGDHSDLNVFASLCKSDSVYLQNSKPVSCKMHAIVQNAISFELLYSRFVWINLQAYIYIPREGVGERVGNLGVILVRVCEPVFQNLSHSYTLPSKKRTHSYTWSSKMLTCSYTALWFFEPIFAGYYTNITVNSCNTKRISSLETSLSQNMCIYQDVRQMGPYT